MKDFAPGPKMVHGTCTTASAIIRSTIASFTTLLDMIRLWDRISRIAMHSGNPIFVATIRASTAGSLGAAVVFCVV